MFFIASTSSDWLRILKNIYLIHVFVDSLFIKLLIIKIEPMAIELQLRTAGNLHNTPIFPNAYHNLLYISLNIDFGYVWKRENKWNLSNIPGTTKRHLSQAWMLKQRSSTFDRNMEQEGHMSQILHISAVVTNDSQVSFYKFTYKF